MASNDAIVKSENAGLVFIHRKDIFTDSMIIAKETGNDHHSITRILRDLSNDFKEFGEIGFMDVASINPAGGRPTKIYLLNEPQASLLITYLENSEKVRAFKIELIKEFYRMRLFLLEKQTAEWQQSRKIGKEARREETDVIMTKLIPLAESQGSKHPEKLYMAYSKLVNGLLGVEAGQRDKLPYAYIDTIRFMERAIEGIISTEADKGTSYKEIYQICKIKMGLLRELSFLPTLKDNERTLL